MMETYYRRMFVKLSKHLNTNFFNINNFSTKAAKPLKYPKEVKIPNSKPFILDRSNSKYRDQLVAFLEEHSYSTDPLGTALGYQELRKRGDPNYIRDMHQYCEEEADAAVNSNPSVGVVLLDPENKLAGMMLGVAKRVPLGVTEMKHANENGIGYTSPFFRNITKTLDELNKGIDYSLYLTPRRAEIVRKRNPPEIILADMSMIATRPDVRKYGLGAAIVAATFEIIHSTECDLIGSYPITHFAYRESAQLGFKSVRKLDWPYGGLPPGQTITFHAMFYSIL